MAKILLEIGCAPHAETCEGCEFLDDTSNLEHCYCENKIFDTNKDQNRLTGGKNPKRCPACLIAEVNRKDMELDLKEFVKNYKNKSFRPVAVGAFLNKYANKEDK